MEALSNILQLPVHLRALMGMTVAGGSTINAQQGGVHVSQPLTVINCPNYFSPASPKRPGKVTTFNFLRQKHLPNPWLRISEHLELMQRHLDNGARPEIYLITGINGSGKSTLASHYASEWLKTSSEKNVIWFNASSEESLKADLESLYAVLDVGPFPQTLESAINLIHEQLRKFQTLLIFDDADDFDSIKEYLPLRMSGDNDKFVTIVTSQNRAFFGNIEDDPEKVICLGQVTPERRDEFLAGIVNAKPVSLKYDAREGAEFAEHFDHLLAPLVSGMKALRKKNQNLALAGEPSYTMSDFNRKIAAWITKEKKMDCIQPDDPDHPREILFKPLRNLWDIEFKRFEMVGYGQTGMDVLDAAAFMSPEGQPEKWIHTVCYDKIQHPLPKPSVQKNAVAYLQTRSLVERFDAREGKGGALRAHKVVSMVRRCLKERNSVARDNYVRALRGRIGVAGDNELIRANIHALEDYMRHNQVTS